jgi:genome maintenance exonuclease 1
MYTVFVEFNKTMRVYEINGKLYPSVTTILKMTESEEEFAENNRWRQFKADSEQDEILAKASFRGDSIHKALENWINDREPLTALSEFGISEARQQILVDELSAFDWIASEKMIVSETHMYAGTMDGLAKYNDETVVIDFKTSNKTYTDSDAGCKLPQLAAYAIALEQEGVNVDAAIIFNLNCKLKKRGFTFYYFDSEELWKAKTNFMDRLIEFRLQYGY